MAKAKVAHSQGDEIIETTDEVLTYENNLPSLLPQNPMYVTIEKIRTINDIRKVEKFMLKDMLTSSGVEVTEEDNMSDLIDKIRQLLGV